jgi:hypothetical protein
MVTSTRPDVVLSLDVGTSGNKVFWRLWTANQSATQPSATQLMLMAPELLAITPADLLETGLAGGRPENDATIQLANGTVYALGMKAQQMQGRTAPPVNKYEFAIYKTLAVIGAIAQTAHLPESFSVAIAVLLPYTEYQDRKLFHDLLTEHLKDFHFRGQHYSVQPMLLEVKPEGAGIAQSRRNESPQDFDQANLLFCILGQRDVSLLLFKQGTPQPGQGARLGFEQFSQSVITRAALNLAAQDLGRLTEYLFQAQADPKRVERIARMVVSEREVPRKVEQLTGAIAAAREKYLRDLLEWLKPALGQNLYELDEVILAGGAALFFSTEISQFFRDTQLKVSWSSSLHTQMNQTLAQPLDPVLACRVADAFGVFKLLGGKVQRLTQDTRTRGQEP